MLFCKTSAVARNYFSAGALMHIRIQAQKGQCHWEQEGEDSSGIFRNSFMFKKHMHTCYMLCVYIPPTAARRLSPEFWSIHCNESMCAFKILQICWSWAEREGASHLLCYIKTKSSKRQPARPCLWNTMQSNFSYAQLHYPSSHFPSESVQQLCCFASLSHQGNRLV